MTTLSAIFFPLFAAWVILSLFYNSALRPMLCDRARFRLFELRDRLRRLAVDAEVRADSFNYIYLERLLCRLIDRAAWYSWTNLFEFLWRVKNPQPSADAVRFNLKASSELKEIHDEAIAAITDAMFVNSPLWTLSLRGLVSVAALFGWAWQQWIEIKTKIFVEEEPQSDTVLGFGTLAR